MASSIEYSRLCDTNLAAYLAYIAVTAVNNGPSLVKSAKVDGGDSVDSSGSCCHGDGGNVVDVYAGLLDKARNGSSQMDFDVSTPDVRRYFDSILGGDGGRYEKPTVGVASGDDCGGVGGVDGDIPAQCGGDDRRESGPAGPSTASVDSDGEHGSVSSRTLLNRARRQQAKARKQRRQTSGCDVRNKCWISDRLAKHSGVKACNEGLQKSVEEKWRVQNELAAEKARRELEILKCNDVKKEAERYRTRILAATERNRVNIEKNFATLRETGNVPLDHDVHTVVSDSESPASGIASDSISPNSSASEADVRKLQKDFIDLQAKVELQAQWLKKAGINPDHLEYYEKSVWTFDADGMRFSEEREQLLEELYPEGYAIPEDPYKGGDGKYRVGISPNH